MLTSITPPVIVLGATSLVGRFLIQRLAKAQIDTVAVSREYQPATTHVKWITVDLQTADLQVETESLFAFSTSPISLLPGALLSLRRAGVRRLVAFSSTSRFTKTQSSIRRERETAQRLIEAEEATQAFCEENDIAWTILRPTLIYAEGRDRNVSRLARLIDRFGVVPLAGTGAGKRQPVHADDLAAGALEVTMSPATENRAYNLPGGETLTYREMCERIFEGLGRRPRIVSIPPRLWLLASEVLAPVVPGITPAVGSRMSDDMTFDLGPANRDFSWDPREFRPVFKPPAVIKSAK
jgi:nucleoside-diphosphate-sugar epimerase